METKNEKLNKGSEEIKNIKMTSGEKSQILNNILKTSTPNTKPIRSPWSFFSFNSNYSPYLRLAVYLILIVGGGEIIINSQGNKNQNNDFNFSTKVNLFEVSNVPNNLKIENKTINSNTTENVVTKSQRQEIIIPKESGSQPINQEGLTASSNYNSAALSPNIIYKTKKDYINNIIVCYENNKIACFPDPSGALNQKPIKLANGYLLKKMPGNVFLNTSIDEFINYKKDDWDKFIKVENIIDYHPFTEIYRCPPGIGEEGINKIILSNNIRNTCEDILNSLISF
jgi:hypothetical protein